MNLQVNINATLIVFPEPLLLVERLKTNETCPTCDGSDFYVKHKNLGQSKIVVECQHCTATWTTEPTSNPVSAFRGDTTARTGIEDIMSKASKARKGALKKKSTAVDALIADKKASAVGTKPKTGRIEKPETPKTGTRTKTDELKGKKLAFVEGKVREAGGTGKVSAAFGKGRKVADVVEEQLETFERGQKGKKDVDEGLIIYFVKEGLKVGSLVEV